MFKKRKASLSLSVNAIVILILAIVMLGLGLSFIRGMFGKVSKQIEQQIAAEPEPPTPTRGNPLTISRESIVTNPGEREVIKIGFFNPTSTPLTLVSPEIKCNQLDIEANSNQKTIDPAEYKIFDVIIKIPSASPDMYLCKINISNYEKDIAIRIKE